MYYILIFIILLLHFLWSNKPPRLRLDYEKNCTLIIGVILVILAAFRSDCVGADTGGYRSDYNEMGSFHSFSSLVDRYSYDYCIYYSLSKLFHIIGLPVQVWFGFIEALYVYALMKLVGNFSKDKILSLLVYTTIGLFSFSLAGLKQTLAMSFMMFSFIGFINKKYLLAGLFVIVTYFTHQSALILLAAYPIFYLRKSRLLIPIALLLCLLIYTNANLFMQIMVDALDSKRYASYLVTNSGYSFTTLIFYAVITMIAGVNFKSYSKLDPEYSMLFLALSILGCGIQSLASVSPSLFRLAFLYTPFMMIIIPNAAYYSKNSKWVRAILMSCIIFYFLYTNRHWPYSFVKLW